MNEPTGPNDLPQREDELLLYMATMLEIHGMAAVHAFERVRKRLMESENETVIRGAEIAYLDKYRAL